jgi:hypothetical protein
MASPPTEELTKLLARLAEAGTEFLLVGGLAAVAQGASFNTQDVDIVHERSPANVDRLLAFLASVNAYYRGWPRDQKLPPARDALLGTGHNLFTTDLGQLDVLGAIEGNRGYADLVANAITIDFEGKRIQVLGLETLADLKRGSTAPKDKLTLAILDATLRLRGR